MFVNEAHCSQDQVLSQYLNHCCQKKISIPFTNSHLNSLNSLLYLFLLLCVYVSSPPELTQYVLM